MNLVIMIFRVVCMIFFCGMVLWYVGGMVSFGVFGYDWN